MPSSFNDVALSTTSLDLLTLDNPLPPETRQRLLRFPFGDDESALLPLEQITEILRLNVAEILPIPKMPNCVLGVANWRGEMLWLVDLNHFVGYSPLSWAAESPVAMVVQANKQTVGLVVQQVNDIELHELEQLQPAIPGLFPARLISYVLGYLPGSDGLVLNIAAITESPLWQLQRGKAS